jgi:hypothetical protein
MPLTAPSVWLGHDLIRPMQQMFPLAIPSIIELQYMPPSICSAWHFLCGRSSQVLVSRYAEPHGFARNDAMRCVG